MKSDLLIRNALIVDGTGAPPFLGSVRVSGERIAEVGECAGTAKIEIDADGLVRLPGILWLPHHRVTALQQCLSETVDLPLHRASLRIAIRRCATWCVLRVCP